jgi:exonuclease SbcD
VRRERRGSDVELHADEWDYVALGDYHVYHAVAPNAYYSGATEYTSSNIWLEIETEATKPEHERGKGIIERDLSTGAHTFHQLESARTIVDLAPIDAEGMTAAQVSDAILAAAADAQDKIVRQVVTGIPKYVVRDLDHRAIRQVKAAALHYLLDTRLPEENAHGDAPLHRKGVPLRELVAEMLGSRVLPADIDQSAFVALGLSYLDAAEAKAAEKAGAENAAA